MPRSGASRRTSRRRAGSPRSRCSVRCSSAKTPGIRGRRSRASSARSGPPRGCPRERDATTLGGGAMKTLVLESTAPFQGLPELVAYDEGLFEKEGLQIEWADRHKGPNTERVASNIITPKGLDPFLTHGKMLEDGKADMYNACEWGNYCRVEETGQNSRQLGRRAIVAYAALVVAPDSDIYTPQQLANRTVGVPFYFGTHYLALHMLEGFLT